MKQGGNLHNEVRENLFSFFKNKELTQELIKNHFFLGS